MTYEAGQVVRVPFPFTRPCRQQEPARVGTVGCRCFQQSLGSSGAGHDHLRQERTLAIGLCPIEDLETAGLPAPSVVRCKLFTLDVRLVRGVLGRLPKPTRPA